MSLSIRRYISMNLVQKVPIKETKYIYEDRLVLVEKSMNSLIDNSVTFVDMVTLFQDPK